MSKGGPRPERTQTDEDIAAGECRRACVCGVWTFNFHVSNSTVCGCTVGQCARVS
jgi:hypothetical protein